MFPFLLLSDQMQNASHSWGLSDKIAVIASIVAFLQFVALVWTVKVMIWNGRRQLRAYVLPDNGGIVDGSMLNPPQLAKVNFPGCGIFIKNYGQTPAYRVLSWMQIAVAHTTHEDTLTVPASLATAGTPAQQSLLTLGSGASFNKLSWFHRALTPNEITDIANGAQAVYLYGRIEYTDAFKKKHFSNFRVRYIGAFPPIPNAVLNFCANGNDAD